MEALLGVKEQISHHKMSVCRQGNIQRLRQLIAPLGTRGYSRLSLEEERFNQATIKGGNFGVSISHSE